MRHDMIQPAPARNTTTYCAFLETLDHAYPQGDLYLVADNLSSHSSGPIREWLAAHPRIHHAFIPVGAAWLNLIEGWWRIFRRKAFDGASLADADDIAYVTPYRHAQLNRHTPLELGTSCPSTAHTLSPFCLSPLRNDALRKCTRSGRGFRMISDFPVQPSG